MKTLLRYTLFIFCVSLLSFSAKAQTETLDNVRLAIKNGNSSKLATYMSSSIDLKISSSDEGVYSNKQASVVLAKFFAREPSTGFKNNHVGSTQTNSKYYSIGTYTTASKSYRVLVSYKLDNGIYLIDKIHFDLE